MRTAQDIINIARFELKSHIIELILNLDAYHATGKRNLKSPLEDGITFEFTGRTASPSVTIDDGSYADTEERSLCGCPVKSITTSDTDHGFFVTVSLFGREMEVVVDDISTDDLLVIAKALEDTYEKAGEK